MDWNVNNAFKTYKEMEPKSVMDMALIQNVDPAEIGLSSAERGNSLASSTKRKKTMTSVYLKYFETAPDGKSRKCKFCGQSYSIATATGNLGRHLSNRHPGYDKSRDTIVTSSPPQPQPITVIKKAQHQLQTKAQIDFDHLNWLLIKWLVEASLPPPTMDERWLANSFKFLNPSIHLWTGDKYKAVLQEVFRSMQEDVRSSLDHVSSKLSVSLDFWTSYEQIFYMSVTCQWIDECWCPHKVLLDICRVPYPCGGSEMYRCLTKVLKSYNLETRILSCTHDNSQVAVHACHALKEELDGLKTGPFCYIPCAAHTLNLIIDDGLRTTKPLISKIRELVLEMNSSTEMLDDFIQLNTAYQEGTWRFPLESSTRWSGNYQMLDLVRKAGKSVDGVMRKYEEALGNKIASLSSTEKNIISIVHGFLEPFHKTTNDISTDKFLTVGLVLFFMDHISETIATCRESRHSPEWLKSSAEEMAKKARSYSTQVCNTFTYMTAILDPRIKTELIPETLASSSSYLEEARTHFARNYSSSSSSATMPHFSSGFEDEDGGNVSFAEEIARKRRRANMSSATDELTQYLSEPPAPIPTDVLEWWKVNGSRYPRLSAMARDFLAVQATSVAPEELFGSRGEEIDKQRFTMPHESTRAVLCIGSWTRNGVKLKYRSTEIDYERLMELAADHNNAATAISDDKKLK